MGWERELRRTARDRRGSVPDVDPQLTQPRCPEISKCVSYVLGRGFETSCGKSGH